MKVITFGEIMLRLTPGISGSKLKVSNAFDVNYAGSESNVATSLSILGHLAGFVTKLPDNELGDGAFYSLQRYGIDISHVHREEGRIGTYFIEMGSSIRPSKVVYDRKDSVFSKIQPGEFNWEDILSDAGWLFISGITPALSIACADELIQVVNTARKMKVKVAFDMNFRRSLWNYGSEAAHYFEKILAKTDILFGNIGVIKDVYNHDIDAPSPEEQVVKTMQHMVDQFDLPMVAFTYRDHSSATQNTLSGYLMVNGSLVQSAEYRVEIKDRFGTGDAFAAGCLHGLITGWGHQKIIDFATAAFALKHTIPGDQHTSAESEIISIMEGHTFGHVIR